VTTAGTVAANEQLPPPGPLRRPGGGKDGKGGGKGRREQHPVIDITGAASPIQERPIDYVNRPAVYSTGQGSVDAYHYDRAPTARDAYAAELAGSPADVRGPGQ